MTYSNVERQNLSSKNSSYIVTILQKLSEIKTFLDKPTVKENLQADLHTRNS